MNLQQVEILNALVPLLIAVLTLLGGGIVYNWQKSIDRNNQILQERRTLYRNFVRCVQFLQMDVGTGNRDHAYGNYTDYCALLAELMVSAPDSVIVPLRQLDENFSTILARAFAADGKHPLFDSERHTEIDDVETLLQNNVEVFERVLIEMRKDSFRDTRLKPGALRKPVGKGW